MVRLGRSSPTPLGVISGCQEGHTCAVCGRDDEVSTLTAVDESPTPSQDGSSYSMDLCTRCAALLIERVSGFRMTRVLAQMYQARDTARDIRLLPPSAD